MAKKQTKEIKRTTPAPALPKISGFAGGGIQVAADVDGELYRIDTNLGTISKLRWE